MTHACFLARTHAAPNDPNEQVSPLSMAAMACCPHTVDALLKGGADPNAIIKVRGVREENQ